MTVTANSGWLVRHVGPHQCWVSGQLDTRTNPKSVTGKVTFLTFLVERCSSPLETSSAKRRRSLTSSSWIGWACKSVVLTYRSSLSFFSVSFLERRNDRRSPCAMNSSTIIGNPVENKQHSRQCALCLVKRPVRLKQSCTVFRQVQS